jgi:hypothetical protein
MKGKTATKFHWKNKKKIAYLLLFAIISNTAFAQSRNFIDQPYLETTVKVDTLVVPDQIFMSIYINEGEDRNKISLEKQEKKMAVVLEGLGIDLKKQLKLQDLSSDFKNYFLKRKNVLKSKIYRLEVFDAVTAGQVLIALEAKGISNVQLIKTAYSKIKQLQIQIKSKAIYIRDEYYNSPVYRDNRMAITAETVEEDSADKKFQKPIDIEFSKIKLQTVVSVKFAIN